MESWLEKLWDLFKIVAPWLTGGVAGATLTYFLNQRIARRKQAKILLGVERVDYSLTSRDNSLKPLHVSYNGVSYANLMLYRFEIRNISSKTINDTPILLKFNDSCSIVDQSTVVEPMARAIYLNKQSGQKNAYIWDVGKLKPRDSAQLRVIITPTTSVEWIWRGEDDVEVISDGHETILTTERELRNILVWIAIYIACDALPFFSGVLHALQILISAPAIISYCLRWWAVFINRDRYNINISDARESVIILGTGEGNIVADNINSSSSSPAAPNDIYNWKNRKFR